MLSSRVTELKPRAERNFSVSLNLSDGYQFQADFGLPGVDSLTLDEPEPLGGGTGPNPARLLAVAVANCLASSLLFCLRKAHIEVQGMNVFATGTMARNEKGRLRMTAVDVTLRPQVAAEDEPRMARCLQIFEDYCPVTAAVRQGLAVRVNVIPGALAA
jgi:organic hydroperoxide reductase OsmC/OhrA